MNFSILYRLLLAHVLSDFLLQSNNLVTSRYSLAIFNRLKSNILHSFIFFLVSLILMIPYLDINTIVCILLLSTLHFLVDYIKSTMIIAKPFLKYSIFFFLFDQLLHLIFIIIFSINLSGIKFINIFPLLKIDSLYSLFYTPINLEEKLLLTLTLVFFAAWGVGTFVKIFISWLQLRHYKSSINLNIELNSKQSYHDNFDGGFIIGILERLFIIAAIVLKAPEVIGFVLATKSIARFKKFDDDRFVEIFIIGSFISFIPAILIGIIIKNLNI